MTILVTGVAGFIGYHVAEMLLQEGYAVIGVDNLNDYYDVQLKGARLNNLMQHRHFLFYPHDIASKEGMESVIHAHPDVMHIIHLAAQPGVRYSIHHPEAYLHSNLAGHLVMLELCRKLKHLKHFVYASSSSVYGGNTKLPFSVKDPVDTPVSLYAATKRADELMTYTYSHLYGVPATGLRFFTVYGPWGRPDMAPWLFTKAIIEGKPIKVFNRGALKRDFTYIEDIVRGILSVTRHYPEGNPPYAIYNLGNNKSEALMDFIHTLEHAIGKEAKMEMVAMQPGDVYETCADITESTRDFGFIPGTSINEGLPKFVEWYKKFYNIS